MPDSLISNHTAYVASFRGCPPSPDRLSVLAGMRRSRIAVTRAFGDAWLKTNNFPALRVPTVITPGEWNVLLNPLHPQFSLKWVVAGPNAYTFDARLLPVKKGN